MSRFKNAFASGVAFALGILATGLVAITVTGTIHTFNSGDLVSASRINENFQSIRTAIESVHEVPVGTIAAWHKDLAAVAIPEGWVECDGSVLNDTDSVYHGKTIPNLNGSGRFLRGGGSSGVMQTDAFQGHKHDISKDANIYEWFTTSAGPNITPPGTADGPKHGSTATGYHVQNPTSDGTNGTPRTSSETRPMNMSVVWIMKVK